MHHGLVAVQRQLCSFTPAASLWAPARQCFLATAHLFFYESTGAQDQVANSPASKGEDPLVKLAGMCGRAPERRRRKLAPKEKRRCCALHPRMSDAQPRVQASGCAGSGDALRVQPGLSGTARLARAPSTAAPHPPHAESAPAVLT